MASTGATTWRLTKRLTSRAARKAVSAARDELAESGRVVLRASGTEPVIRVMVEGSDEDQVNSVAERLAAVVAEAASEKVPKRVKEA